MANVSLKLTNYGLKKVMTSGAKASFTYFSLSDINEIYYVTNDPNMDDIMNITGSKNLFTARKSCTDAIPTEAETTQPSQQRTTNISQRLLVNFYKTNCGIGDYDKSNLDITINLHEYFSWLEGVVNSGYTESMLTSLKLIDGIDLVKQEQDFITKGWSNIDSTNRLNASYDFVTDEDKNNYLKFGSKYVTYTNGVKTQTDKSFDRFYSSLMLGFGTNVSGGYYLEGVNSYLTFQSPQFGYVVNGKTNFITMNQMLSPDSYKEITPAVTIGSNSGDLYYLKEPKNYKTKDINGFMGQAIWGYVNLNGQSLIKGMIEKAKNHIEYYFKETSFNKWELPIGLKLKVTNNSGLNVIGGNVKYNFVYDRNVTPSGYNNILIIK